MAPRGSSRLHHCTWEMIRWSELHGYAGVERALGAGVVADTRRDDALSGVVMVEAEFILPVAIGNPDIYEVRVFLTPECLAGVKGQTDRFAIELGLGGNAAACKSERSVLVAFRPIPSCTATD